MAAAYRSRQAPGAAGRHRVYSGRQGGAGAQAAGSWREEERGHEGALHALRSGCRSSTCRRSCSCSWRLADGRLQPEEAAKFAAEISDASRYRDPLLRELLFDLSRPAEFQTAFEAVARISSTSADAIDREITGIKALLKRQADATRSTTASSISLIGIGKMVADVGGRGEEGRLRPQEVRARHEPRGGPVADQSWRVEFGVDLDAGKRAVERL